MKPGSKWRVEECQIKALRRAFEPFQRIGLQHDGAAGRQGCGGLAQLLCALPVGLDEGGGRSTTGQRLEPQRATAGEQVQATASFDHGREPVEEGFADPVRCRPYAGLPWKPDPAPAPFAPDDPQFIWFFAVHCPLARIERAR